MVRFVKQVLLSSVLLAVAGGASAADRPWAVSASARALYPDMMTAEDPVLARGYGVEVTTPLRPWFAVGGGVQWDGFPARHGLDSIEGWYETGRSDAVTIAAVSRFQVPVGRGPAPFLVARNGVTTAFWGESRSTSMSTQLPYVYRSRHTEYLWSSEVGIGVRAVLPGRLPDPELSIAQVVWASTASRRPVASRLALVF